MIIDKQNATFMHNASLLLVLLYSKHMLHPISNIPSMEQNFCPAEP